MIHPMMAFASLPLRERLKNSTALSRGWFYMCVDRTMDLDKRRPENHEDFIREATSRDPLAEAAEKVW